MSVLNFGSLNIDHVYSVDHFVKPGETISSSGYAKFCGGKGLNQSIALASAGATVYHAGLAGEDGAILTEKLAGAGVDISLIRSVSGPSGHAIIQVDKSGENCIIICGGANRLITREYISSALAGFGRGDWLLLQNEINELPYIMNEAVKRGMKLAFNPAPMDQAALACPLDLVDLFIVNRTEGAALSGGIGAEDILDRLCRRFPKVAVALTLGGDGVMYAGDGQKLRAYASKEVEVVDTTAAGDTFTGYFLAGLSQGRSAADSLRTAAAACDICVSRKGASDSIPKLSEVGI